MDGESSQVELPRARLCRWLVDSGCDVPPAIRRALVTTLFGASTPFVLGEINNALLACVVAARIPTAPFLIWTALQLVLAMLRIRLQVGGRRALARGEIVRPDLYLAVALTWAATIGYGTYISVASGDWVAATLASTSAAAMVGAICFRSYGVPRLVIAMISLVLGPCALAATLSGEPIMLLAGLQLPLYLGSMGLTSFALHRMLVRTMQAERRNRHHARHDPLTGLKNRGGLAHWAAMQLAPRAAADRAFVLFYVDLDGFKAVNDRLGHACGDLVLAEVAARLGAFAGSDDAVARLGGDEFVVIAACGGGEAERLGAGIVEAIAGAPFLLGDVAATVGASVGAAVFPAHGETLEALLHVADMALYEAKAAGEPCCVIAPARTEPARLCA
ncbi:GGDEF domain-containing protein [Sphingomonas parva]|uniref:GGDEF domain-containing protein n=1 Tax=Sphingomonas parva TaxID=2555898 RepID=A0A4Y8ZTV1_9SPHN|nr:GGDEF domain-containing protein [Sphingomonas parva]TFI59344.1 GGDEF domain-containing protein [Sphingomonas parva]